MSDVRFSPSVYLDPFLIPTTFSHRKGFVGTPLCRILPPDLASGEAQDGHACQS